MDMELKMLAGIGIVSQIITIVITIFSERKIPAIWESEDGLWGISFLWIKMNTFKRRKVLKYLFINEESLDYKTKRVPLWMMICKSNIYINIISFIATIIFFSEDAVLFQIMTVMATWGSIVTCVIIVPIIEYLLWRFVFHEERYIERFVILRVIFWYVVIQAASIYISIFIFMN